MKSLPALAVRLVTQIARTEFEGLVVGVDGDNKAEVLARLMKQLAPDLPVVWFPAWDCLPYDKAAPSADVMGHRMRALMHLARYPTGTVTVTTPEALVQRLPPKDTLPKSLRLKVGTRLDIAAFADACARFGYVHADRVDDPGHLAIRGEIIDIHPPLPRPYRIAFAGDRITSIHTYDAETQHTIAEVTTVRIDPVSEVVIDAVESRFVGMEHWLPEFYPGTTTLLGNYCAAPLVLSKEAQDRLAPHFAELLEAHRDRVVADKSDRSVSRSAVRPDALYMTPAEWKTLTKGRIQPFPTLDGLVDTPRFCLEDKPGLAFSADLKQRRSAGQRIVLSGPREKDLAVMAKEAERATGQAPARVASWQEAAGVPAETVALLHLSADHGFEDPAAKLALITAADLIGHYARARPAKAVHLPWHLGEGELASGDVVIHVDHGVCVLKGLESISVEDAPEQDSVRLTFADTTDLLVPVSELDRVWRYGHSGDDVAVDRLDSPAWHKRRAKINEDVNATAATLLASAQARNDAAAPKIVPPRREYEQFVSGFRFSPTADQMHAVEDCLRDLASGRPMNRLVVGDVGFGKTEVALRAAAATVLAGYQVAVLAPTTVLVRQHVHGFAQRFTELGISVASLSRLSSSEETEAVHTGLRDGRVRLVVGTHALVGPDVAFRNLGLVIIDEEQRFGMAEKAAIHRLSTGLHVLTLTATPIPRTLQSAMVGLQDLSVMTTPPARRRPIRTHLMPFDAATLRTALLKEKARGGQSFVVVPRIEDLTPLEETLRSLVPDLVVRTGHGRMDAEVISETMTNFSSGDGDLLLATTIIESGLDVPRANTMVVCGAERFGLAQLHQLRGRVGRGRQQGICYLMTAGDHAVSGDTQRRLSTLTKFDRLGSGLVLSANDLDARGAGDLTGEDQAGHLHLIGLGLYQHLLQRALRQAQGQAADDWVPELHVGASGRLDPDYIPEPDIRLNLYARLARIADIHELDTLAEEVGDRFGPLPEAAATLFARAQLRCLCVTQAIARVDAGPKAIALTPRHGLSPEGLLARLHPRHRAAVTIKGDRLLYELTDASSTNDRLRLAADLLHSIG